MEIKPGGDFDLGDRTMKSIGDDAYSEISAMREELRRTREALDMAVEKLYALQQILSLNAITTKNILDAIRKGPYDGSP